MNATVHASLIDAILKLATSVNVLFLNAKAVNGARLQRISQVIENKQQRPFIKSFTKSSCERLMNGERSQ